MAARRALGHPLLVDTADVPAWYLRRSSPADLEWAFELHCAALREYVEPIWGWDEELQRRLFADGYDANSAQVIQAYGEDVGILVVEDRAEELYLRRIELLPAWQGKGLGTSILSSLLHRAHASGRPISLHVLKSNPRAAQLYERIGLRVVSADSVKLAMRSTP
jgi:GNAT superfamily N-acetyltransferase